MTAFEIFELEIYMSKSIIEGHCDGKLTASNDENGAVFKSLEGAQNYANLRSIIDTSRKRGLNEFESLVSVMQGSSLF